jgi:hypothetical protein
MTTIDQEISPESCPTQVIPFNVALDVVKNADATARISAIRQLVAPLFEELRVLNPITNEHGKYAHLQIDAHGYDHLNLEFEVYYGSALRIKGVESFEQIATAIREFSPEAVKEKRKAELRAELAKLEAA